VDCIPYVGATSDTSLGTCVFYHVTNPPSASNYTGPVNVRIFWDFPTLAILNNVRLYRAPLDGVPPDGTCTQGFNCYTQDITDQVFAIGDHNADAGVSGSGTGFSDFEAVDQTSPTSTAARVWIGLKNSDDVGTNFDLKAEVYKNATLIGSGETLNVSGGSSGFNNAKNRAVALALSQSNVSFLAGDKLSIKLYVKVTAVGGHRSGTARLWFNDAQADTHFDATINGTTNNWYIRAGGGLETTPGAGPKTTIDVFSDRLVGGNPYKLFGTWTHTF
jgi:hypothetical protein